MAPGAGGAALEKQRLRQRLLHEGVWMQGRVVHGIHWSLAQFKLIALLKYPLQMRLEQTYAAAGGGGGGGGGGVEGWLGLPLAGRRLPKALTDFKSTGYLLSFYAEFLRSSN